MPRVAIGLAAMLISFALPVRADSVYYLCSRETPERPPYHEDITISIVDRPSGAQVDYRRQWYSPARRLRQSGVHKYWPSSNAQAFFRDLTRAGILSLPSHRFRRGERVRIVTHGELGGRSFLSWYSGAEQSPAMTAFERRFSEIAAQYGVANGARIAKASETITVH